MNPNRPTATLPYPLPLAFLIGLSDSGREIVHLGKNRQPQITLMGTCSYMPHLTPGRFAIRELWLGGKDRHKLPLPTLPPVNYIADPDNNSIALRQAIEIVERLGKPCFNDPRLIAQTRRDQIAQRLSGIPGLIAPRTVLIQPRRPTDFSAAASEHGLNYPLIVRLAGDHGGISTIRIDDAGKWDETYTLPWIGRSVYLTEFADFRDLDGLYRKCRIVFTGGRMLLHHVIISKEWLVHRGSRLNSGETAEEERYWLTAFEQDHLPRFQSTLSEIQRIIGLDYFGLDCHLGRDNIITLFEANAAMNVLSYDQELSHWNEPKARIRSRLEASLEKFARASMAAAVPA